MSDETRFPLSVVRDLVEEAYRLGYADADNGRGHALDAGKLVDETCPLGVDMSTSQGIG